MYFLLYARFLLCIELHFVQQVWILRNRLFKFDRFPSLPHPPPFCLLRLGDSAAVHPGCFRGFPGFWQQAMGDWLRYKRTSESGALGLAGGRCLLWRVRRAWRPGDGRDTKSATFLHLQHTPPRDTALLLLSPPVNSSPAHSSVLSGWD